MSLMLELEALAKTPANPLIIETIISQIKAVAQLRALEGRFHAEVVCQLVNGPKIVDALTKRLKDEGFTKFSVNTNAKTVVLSWSDEQ